RPTRHTPFPYTTLFRSQLEGGTGRRDRGALGHHGHRRSGRTPLSPRVRDRRARGTRELRGHDAPPVVRGAAVGGRGRDLRRAPRSEEHTSELQSLTNLV